MILLFSCNFQSFQWICVPSLVQTLLKQTSAMELRHEEELMLETFTKVTQQKILRVVLKAVAKAWSVMLPSTSMMTAY